MIYDCHLHTEFSGDSNTPISLQIEKAIELGMKEMCITDHHDYDSGFCDCDFILDIPTYLTSLRMLQAEYRDRIRINIGIELGLQDHLKEYLEHFVKRYGDSFDFIIGSSHLAHGKDPYQKNYFEGITEEEGYREYFESILENIAAFDGFDVYGHIDYVVRYGPNKNANYSYQKYADIIDEILKALIIKGKGIEINTGGFKYGLGHPNPAEDIIKRYHELGGEIITIGADAHQPEHVAFDFEKVPSILKEAGFTHYTVFKNRKPEFIPIP